MKVLDFGVVLQTDPPAQRVIDLAKRAEAYGFTHAWTFDSHLLWEEPFVIYSRILNETHRLIVGPMVTNPATRDWTVTASLFATLNEMYGNRTVCGIGRGDSAVRVINGKPVRLAELREAIGVIRGLANGEQVDYKGSSLRLAWNPHSRLEVWVAAYGPKALALAGESGDGFILQLADPAIAEWSIAAVRRAAEEAGKDPDTVKICIAAPAYVTDGSEAGLAHAREQCRWFGGMVGNHVADIVARYGADGGGVPKALTDYIKDREGYDYNEHGKAGNTHTQFVPDSIVDRFCLIGPPEEHVRKLQELRDLGADQFALYLQHDAKDATLARYGELVIPQVNEREAAKTSPRVTFSPLWGLRAPAPRAETRRALPRPEGARRGHHRRLGPADQPPDTAQDRRLVRRRHHARRHRGRTCLRGSRPTRSPSAAACPPSRSRWSTSSPRTRTSTRSSARGARSRCPTRRTAPAPRSRTSVPSTGVRSLTFAFVSCQNYAEGCFTPYDETAASEDIETVPGATRVAPV